MRLLELARTFAQLEETSSRRELVRLVAELLSEAEAAELEPVVYLLLGTLRPPWEGIETGIGEKLLIPTLARAYGVTAEVVKRRMARAGDMGLVAESLAPRKNRSRVTVRQAYQVLLTVAGAAGAGSTGRKTTLLASLLGKVGPLEARFLVRAAQGRLRLGVGDQTILEAAAEAALGDRRKKPLLEHAYKVRSDLGEIVRITFSKGESALRRIGPQVGIPVLPALAQRVSSADEAVRRLGRVQLEPKYDGFRLQFHRRGKQVRAFSRRLENVTGMFPELAAAMLRLRSDRVILEGEALVHNPESGEFLPFQVTMTRKRKTLVDQSAERYPLRLFAFDLLYVAGQNWLEKPQRERSRRLRSLLGVEPDRAIVATETVETDDVEVVQGYFDDMTSRGLEGIIAKRPDAAYQAGARGYHWVKLKRAYHSRLRDTVDLVLVGYLRGRGRRASLGIGSLLGAVHDPRGERFRTVAKIGSGLSEQAWQELRRRLHKDAVSERPRNVDSLIRPDVWVRPRYVVEVLADEITRSPSHTCGRKGDEPGYALRFPRMLQVRTDKGPAEATTEREVIELFKKQRKAR